ncbi:IS66 family transposase [Halioxenophilus sp. WMMB6]
MDNNPAERAIRPFTIGRKNWFLVKARHALRPVPIYTA